MITTPVSVEGETYDRLFWVHDVPEMFPRIRDTSITADKVILIITSGNTWIDVLNKYPELTEDDVDQCLRWALAVMIKTAQTNSTLLVDALLSEQENLL